MRDIEKIMNDIRAEILPLESWERLPGETAGAYAAFCAYRDFGSGRKIKAAVLASLKGIENINGVNENAVINSGFAPNANAEKIIAKRYKTWRGWSVQFKWRERAEAYDDYLDKLKQAEMRKTIEAQGEAQRAVTGKMLEVVSKKLDLMQPGELEQKVVSDWVATAIKAERSALEVQSLGLGGNCGNGPNGINGANDDKQQILFASEFEGL
jgi:hypothetical protein